MTAASNAAESSPERGASDPAPACSYCGIEKPECLVRCNVPTCRKWFCNSRRNVLSSHIVFAKHKEVSLHNDRPFGGAILECYSCSCRNVFHLGLFNLQTEIGFVLLCREPCLSLHVPKGRNWDLSEWFPLVDDRCFLEWLVEIPSEEEQLRAFLINAQEIIDVEGLWKTNPDFSVKDLGKPGVDDKPQPVNLTYEDAYQYQNVFVPLIKMEDEYSKVIRESQSKANLTIRWEEGLNKNYVAYFVFPEEDNELRLVPGDELRLQYPGDAAHPLWHSGGHVIKLTAKGEVALKLHESQGVPVVLNHGFSVDFVSRSHKFDRMLRALETFASDETSVSRCIYHQLLGHEVELPGVQHTLPSSFDVPGLPELDPSYVSAIKSVLEKSITLIEAPPGIGKTVTSAAIVYHMAKQGKGQVLVCAPSNVVVDQLAEKISSTGLKVARLCANSIEAASSPVEHLTLHYQVRQVDAPEKSELRELQHLKDEQGKLPNAKEKKLKALKRVTERELLQSVDVICCTCVDAGDPRLSDFIFRQVLIDESTLAVEPECLICLVRGVEQAVLVGVECQFGGPVIMCKRAAQAGLAQSLFVRLVLLKLKPFRLQISMSNPWLYQPAQQVAAPAQQVAAPTENINLLEEVRVLNERMVELGRRSCAMTHLEALDEQADINAQLSAIQMRHAEARAQQLAAWSQEAAARNKSLPKKVGASKNRSTQLGERSMFRSHLKMIPDGPVKTEIRAQLCEIQMELREARTQQAARRAQQVAARNASLIPPQEGHDDKSPEVSNEVKTDAPEPNPPSN